MRIFRLKRIRRKFLEQMKANIQNSFDLIYMLFIYLVIFNNEE